jgi:hypothetical protein
MAELESKLTYPGEDEDSLYRNDRIRVTNGGNQFGGWVAIERDNPAVNAERPEEGLGRDSIIFFDGEDLGEATVNLIKAGYEQYGDDFLVRVGEALDRTDVPSPPETNELLPAVLAPPTVVSVVNVIVVA